ncbi:unnamed protein product, partial [Meganyctiphanes norvegica]
MADIAVANKSYADCWILFRIILPTLLIFSFFVLLMLFNCSQNVEFVKISADQAMIRARMLRENGKFLPKQSFLMRRHFFNNEESGYLKTVKRASPPQPMTDPNMMVEMLKGNVTNVLPMIAIGGWINWTFSGFVTTIVPLRPSILAFGTIYRKNADFVILD